MDRSADKIGFFRVRSVVRYALCTPVFLLGLSGGATREAFAALPENTRAVEVTARITPAECTVGDPLLYTVTVTHPAGTRATLPALRGNIGDLEVLGYTVRTDSSNDGQRIDTHTLTVAAYATGPDTLPPQRVEIRSLANTDDTSSSVLYSPATILIVHAVTPKNAKDIADIQDSERLPGVIPWGLPILVAFLALVFWLYRKWKAWKARRAIRPPPAPVAPLVTAEETALARLRALEDAGLIGSSDPEAARRYAFRLSEILREYLAERFGIDALEATTSELLQRSAPLPLLPEQHVWLGEAAVELDVVKFATGILAAADATRLLAGSRRFVQATPPSQQLQQHTAMDASA